MFLKFYIIGSILALILSCYILSKTKIERDNNEVGSAVVSMMVLSWIAVFFLIKQIIENRY